MKDLVDYLIESEQMNFETVDVQKIQSELEKLLKPSPVKFNIKKDGSFNLQTLWIYIDYLKEEDWPHGIMRNSIIFCFKYEFKDNKLSIFTAYEPHVYLSPYDQEHDFKYLAMRGAVNLGKECGVKFVKSKAKNEKEIATKIAKYLNPIMDIITIYTGGYPYKKGILNEPLKDAYKR